LRAADLAEKDRGSWNRAGGCGADGGQNFSYKKLGGDSRFAIRGLTFVARFSMIGELLGNYRILAQLGSGSMGIVFLAEHQRLLRRVAIKLLAPALVRDQQALQRFFNEALATASTRHPGIVDVFDCDVDAGGRAYLVLEHLEGETLADRLEREQRLDWPAACLIARQAADALGAVHGKGIVHRDLKPENLFLVGDPADAAATVVKVLDFGVAKLLAVDAAARLTMRGMLVGTPEYMSPEQCAGSEIDHRADIYALGCILFEMLGGLPPFVAETIRELTTAHQFFPPPALPASAGEVAAPLRDLLARMLAKDPGHRPASMHDVAEALRALMPPAALPPVDVPVRQPGAGKQQALLARLGAPRVAVTFALAAGFVLTAAIATARRKPASRGRAETTQASVTMETRVPPPPPPAPGPMTDGVPSTLAPVFSTTAATARAPAAAPRAGGLAPSRIEPRPARAARAARPASRPSGGEQPQRPDADGIVDL